MRKLDDLLPKAKEIIEKLMIEEEYEEEEILIIGTLIHDFIHSVLTNNMER